MHSRKLRRKNSNGLPKYSVFPFALNKSREFDGIFLLEDFNQRIERSQWLKAHFGRRRIPLDMFKLIIDADVQICILERWFGQGGMEYVWWASSILFAHREADYTDIQEQLEHQEDEDGREIHEVQDTTDNEDEEVQMEQEWLLEHDKHCKNEMDTD